MRSRLQRAIPAHAGLGSGTQLALAIAAAVRHLHGLESSAPDIDAALLGRGLRSGIGIALFGQGGFVVDGGRGEASTIPPLLTRVPVPSDWRVLLLHDPGYQGLSGEQEKRAFRMLPPMAESDVGRICRLVLMQVVPALMEFDLPRFGGGITEIQRILGRHFAQAQGGLFASPRVGAALQWLEREGAMGIGQTSWGPSGFRADRFTGRRGPPAAHARRNTPCGRPVAEYPPPAQLWRADRGRLR